MINLQEISINCVGYAIKANLYETNSDYILLNLIGYSSNKDKYKDFIEYIVDSTGISAITIDYSGHGKSPFELENITPAQNFLEVITTFDWIRKKFPEKDIYVMGASYGGFLATQLTKYRSFKKLVLRVPAIYKPKNFYTTWGDYEIEEGLAYRETAEKLVDHPLLKRASKFEGDTFVITHELDDVCPVNSTNAFVEAFKADHWVAKGFKHGFGESDITSDQRIEYYKKVSDWLAQ